MNDVQDEKIKLTIEDTNFDEYRLKIFYECIFPC